MVRLSLDVNMNALSVTTQKIHPVFHSAERIAVEMDLDVHISNNFTWSANTASSVKEGPLTSVLFEEAKVGWTLWWRAYGCPPPQYGMEGDLLCC